MQTDHHSVDAGHAEFKSLQSQYNALPAEKREGAEGRRLAIKIALLDTKIKKMALQAGKRTVHK